MLMESKINAIIISPPVSAIKSISPIPHTPAPACLPSLSSHLSAFSKFDQFSYESRSLVNSHRKKAKRNYSGVCSGISGIACVWCVLLNVVCHRISPNVATIFRKFSCCSTNIHLQLAPPSPTTNNKKEKPAEHAEHT